MRRFRWLLRIAIAASLAATTAMMGRIGISQARQSPNHGVAGLPAIPFLEALSLGYRNAAADLCWMQAVQYYGEHRQGGNDLSEFGHYLDAVNTLDPRYEHAYLLGAVVVATDGHDLGSAIDVLRRGAAANPSSHRFAFHMGFLTYVVAQDVDRAIHYFRRAAKYPQGRERALRFQAFLNRRLGRLETAWALWNDLYENTQDEAMRSVAAASLRRIEAALEAQRP